MCSMSQEKRGERFHSQSEEVINEQAKDAVNQQTVRNVTVLFLCINCLNVKGEKYVLPNDFLSDDLYESIAVSCDDPRCGRDHRTCDSEELCKPECFTNKDCNDNKKCTQDICVEGQCIHNELPEPTGYCGDDVCQDGENCENCPEDCRSRLTKGKPKNYFCCYGGDPSVIPTFVDRVVYRPYMALSCEHSECHSFGKDCDATVTCPR